MAKLDPRGTLSLCPGQYVFVFSVLFQYSMREERLCENYFDTDELSFVVY